MKNFLNNRMTTLAAILVIATGSFSIIGMSQAVMGSDGGNINGSIVACVYGACKDNTFNGGTSGAAGGGGQPTPTTGTLIVIKKVATGLFCPQGSRTQCKPSDFTIK